ncbi:PQQ-dependent dehydrogenase, methanol/ethanol family [Metabacillus bambusae]|uniref:PQQ-dependent dehydrogenase, methanol/ethanol family n=1 Tax=Metabacillus bambusae TaxID=2795218 RepID=A0ABS3N8D0_9BACI|nr:PQQ-dependent dehydrogenase, methanol/ethanol family [Metabacillus bambusae]MBO1514552.1 PQQ-dependent dehydrogenase, methanol/ethanol family [Metabacillus bambusae]
MKSKSLYLVLLTFLLVLSTACQSSQSSERNQMTESKPKETEGTESTDSDSEETEEATAENTNSTDVALVKQHKNYEGDVSPAFTTEEMTTLPKEDWVTNGGNVYNQRYSPLDQINKSTISGLKGEWVAHLGSGFDFKYSGEASPVVYDGVMFVITGENDVLALDAKTGETIWEYRPKIAEKLSTVCCGWTSRGVAIGEGKVFVGLLDARLVALDQKTGEVVWETKVDEWEKGFTITSAPLYYNGKVFTGISGGEYGIRGRVTAYDAELGRELWRFNTVPGPGEVGHETWPSDNKAWMTGGAPVWQTPAVDPELGMLYFSTGNAAPDLDGSLRKGDNLFSASVVAIDVETGEYKWHFQQVHHDIWDLDSPNPVILFDVEKDGEMRKAIGSAGKTGWVYFLDRTNGKPLIGINETPVPQDERQATAATQPIPVGDSFVPQVVTEEDIKRDIPNYKGKIGKIFDPFWEEPVVTKPSAFGGANWPPSAYNPETELFYVLGNDSYMSLTRSEEELEQGNTYVGSIIAPVEEAPVRGTVTAMDVKTNKVVWQQKWDTLAYSGALTTKGGLVFVGHSDGRFIALDAKTGDQLWEFMTDAGVNAPPISYEIDGKQYITVFAAGNSLAGSKHGDSVWTFSLDGTIEKVEDAPKAEAYPDDKNNSNEEEQKSPDDKGTETTANVDEGRTVYEANCLACHGRDGADGHNGPNLQKSEIAKDHNKVVEKINQGGTSMPSFEGNLSEAEINSIADYITEVVAKQEE